MRSEQIPLAPYKATIITKLPSLRSLGTMNAILRFVALLLINKTYFNFKSEYYYCWMIMRGLYVFIFRQNSVTTTTILLLLGNSVTTPL